MKEQKSLLRGTRDVRVVNPTTPGTSDNDSGGGGGDSNDRGGG